MKCNLSLVLILGLFIIACNANEYKHKSKLKMDTTIFKSDEVGHTLSQKRSDSTNLKVNNVLIPSDIEKIDADRFSLPLPTIRGNMYTRTSGEISVYDQAWFKNDSLNQALIFQIYPEGFIAVSFLLDITFIPNELLNRIEMEAKEQKSLDYREVLEKERKKYFKGLLMQSKYIDCKYFMTEKGFKLGDRKDKAISLYGKPNKITKSKGVERYDWIFVGEEVYKKGADLHGNAIVRESIGHDVSMFFKEEVLIGLILHNEVY